MSEHQRFHYHAPEELHEDAAKLGITLPWTDDLSILGDSVKIGGLSTPNRFVVHPMEGFDSDDKGTPGPLSFRRYRRYAEGGAGLIWFEATAVLWEARSNPGQLWLHDENVATYAKLVAETKQAARAKYGVEPLMIVQLTHSGRYSKPAGVPKPIIAHHSAILDPKHNLPEDYPLVTDEYLDQLQEHFVHAAELAAKAGFDGVDIKGCHRYLAAELHASHTREGRYGGSFENRTRLLRETMTKIRSRVPSVFVTTRLNAYDAISYPYGFGVSKDDYRVPDLTEPIEFIGLLKEIGIPLLNLSIGNPYYNPHFGRPYDFPIAGFTPPAEHPLAAIDRFVSITRTVQEAHPDLPIIGSGYSWLRQFVPQVAAAIVQSGGATLVGQGRGSFAYPDSVQDILEKGAMDPKKCCVTCSGCTQIMRDGAMTGCVVRDKEIYGEQYRLGRRFAVDRLQAEARRCRECTEPTCRPGCPANVDIPSFVKAFGEGDFAKSYAVLRENNVLPEMCGFICPAAEQCEGGCVEDIFTKCAVPIQDIQLMAAKTARRMGLTGVSIPAEPSGKRVAIIGGGPAGLAGAIKLLEAGHNVTIVDKANRLGGTPETTIPAARYADAGAEIDAILAPAKAADRVILKLGAELGKDFTFTELVEGNDAVLLATGLPETSSIGEAKGVYDALTFLAKLKAGELTDLPDRLAVLGAGNTAMDAASSALDAGVRDVYLVYRRSFLEMPAWAEERDDFLAKGGHVLLLTQPVGYETDDQGVLTGLRAARTELGQPDASGRRRPEVIANSEFVLPVGIVVEAMGQKMGDMLAGVLAGVALTGSGKVAVNASFSTSLPGVFAAGDLVNGGTTAVQGIAEGMRAASCIDAYLSK
jgi:NADPH-dependent glutamate synthase beta subunit-like oxidoreductase/2,4-dienoyl-CoA reductase-like NADH-dependent reductase (Old Yellow Enzyme family)